MNISFHVSKIFLDRNAGRFSATFHRGDEVVTWVKLDRLKYVEKALHWLLWQREQERSVIFRSENGYRFEMAFKPRHNALHCTITLWERETYHAAPTAPSTVVIAVTGKQEKGYEYRESYAPSGGATVKRGVW